MKYPFPLAALSVLLLTGCVPVVVDEQANQVIATRQQIDQGKESVVIGNVLLVGDVQVYPYIGSDGSCSLPPGIRFQMTNTAGVPYHIVCHEKLFYWVKTPANSGKQ